MSFDLKHIAQPQAAFSPQHKKLNRLIDQIEQQKIELSKWQNSQAEILQHVRQKLLPIYSELHQILFAQLERLWANVQSDEFSKAEQQLLDEKTAELAKILKKSKSLSSQQHEFVNKINVFYFQLRNEKVKAKAVIETQKLVLENSVPVDDEIEEWDSEKFQRERELHKQKKQQEKREQAEKMAEQSLKTVYLKITAMIHPDREPDEEKKVEKTELQQVVNEAHTQQDLYYLLKLQLQLEQNKGTSSKALSAEQVKLYQLALEGQSQKLAQKINEIIEGFYISKPVRSEAEVYKAIDADVVTLKQQVKWEKERLKYFGKVSGLKMLMERGVL
ncbi:molecular chaperone DnaJ [Acinetobacter sp. ULE_I010]|uniref:molecular chaperone DnaJ n=1 Tax=Acinetobacter sp. ULE_I010 TaxID=3373065 RepID=UPI003AF40E47